MGGVFHADFLAGFITVQYLIDRAAIHIQPVYHAQPRRKADERKRAQDANDGDYRVHGGARHIKILAQEQFRAPRRRPQADCGDNRHQYGGNPRRDGLRAHAQYARYPPFRRVSAHDLLGFQLGGFADSIKEANQIAEQAHNAAHQRNLHSGAQQRARLPTDANGDILFFIAHRKDGGRARFQTDALRYGGSADTAQLAHGLPPCA